MFALYSFGSALEHFWEEKFYSFLFVVWSCIDSYRNELLFSRWNEDFVRKAFLKLVLAVLNGKAIMN
jgi:hypothetical protein